MTRFEGEEVHNKDNGIKVGPDGQFTIIQTHLPNMHQRGLEPAFQDCDTIYTIILIVNLLYMIGSLASGCFLGGQKFN